MLGGACQHGFTGDYSYTGQEVCHAGQSWIRMFKGLSEAL